LTLVRSSDSRSRRFSVLATLTAGGAAVCAAAVVATLVVLLDFPVAVEVCALVLFIALLSAFAMRARRRTSLMVMKLVPGLAAAAFNAVSLIAAIVARHLWPDAAGTQTISLIAALSCAGVAIGFLAGLSRWRRFENRALRQLAASLASHPPALTLRETSELLSEAMDPSLELIHRPPGHQAGTWLDTEGRTAPAIGTGATRRLTTITADDGHVVALVHDAALEDSATFLAVMRSSVLKALENERLGAELRNSLRELRESRARIMTSADRERQRIERDLHDGAQQSLVALRIRLGLASQLLSQNPVRAERLLSELALQVDATLEEVRSLARGVYPPLLADRGLEGALHAVALRSPVPTTVDADGVGRFGPEIEAAVYFCCLEAMQNAMKHAHETKGIAVSLFVVGDLHFEIADTGAGFDPQAVMSGGGLMSMRDRLAAIGGVLTIRTAPGRGTCVTGLIPLAQNRSALANGSTNGHMRSLSVR
jgi:signal transduction histidine kinase